MEVLGVERPPSQRDWAFDGVSVLPILREFWTTDPFWCSMPVELLSRQVVAFLMQQCAGGETPAPRGIGWIFDTPSLNVEKGYGYRCVRTCFYTEAFPVQWIESSQLFRTCI